MDLIIMKLSRVALFLLLATVGIGIAFRGLDSQAAGGGAMLQLTPAATSAVANGSSLIVVSVYVYSPKCGESAADGSTCPDGSTPVKHPITSREVLLQTSSSGLVFGGTNSNAEGVRSVVTGADGYAQFTLASTAAGTKQVTATFDIGWGSPGNGPQTVSLTFTAPVAAPAPTPKPTATPTPTPAPTPIPPAALTTSSLEVDGKPLPGNEPITLESHDPLILKGQTVPGGVIKLYIFSTPREATVTANAQGVWSYTLQGLEPGSHHVEAEVTDPATQKTSARATLASFTVKQAKAAQVNKPAAAQKSWLSQPLVWLVFLLGLAAAGTIIWWLRRHRTKSEKSVDSPGVPK